MKLSLDQLISKANTAWPAVVWISSEEDLLAIEALDQLRAAARKSGFSERSVLTVTRYTTPSDITELTGSMSLFAEQRLIEVRFAAGKINKELGQHIANLAAQLPSDTRILVSSPRLDSTTTKAAWFEQLTAKNWWVPVYAITRAQLPQWIGQRLAAQKQTADTAILEWLADKVEGNLLAAAQEIRKLALLNPQGALDNQTVQNAVTNVARYDQFTVFDPALSGQLQQSLNALNGLQAEGEAVQALTWSASETVRTLLRIKAASRGGASVNMAQFRLFGQREATFTRAAQTVPYDRLLKALDWVALADRAGKGVPAAHATNPWEALEHVACLLAGKGVHLPEFSTSRS
jgi:DNA polymerase III subunit delta